MNSYNSNSLFTMNKGIKTIICQIYMLYMCNADKLDHIFPNLICFASDFIELLTIGNIYVCVLILFVNGLYLYLR